MKKILTIAVFTMACISGNAQTEDFHRWSIIPKIGVTAATSSMNSGCVARYGYTGGVEARYKFTPIIAVSAGVNYSQYGMGLNAENSYSSKPIKLSCNYDYITVPVMINILPYQSSPLLFKAGVEVDFNVKKDFESPYKWYTSTSQSVTPKSTMITIPLALSYEFKCGIALEARCNIGATTAFEERSVRQIIGMFTAGYKFNL